MKRRGIIIILCIPFLFSCPTEDYFSHIEGLELLTTDDRAFIGWTTEYSKTVSMDYLEFTEASADAGSTDGLSADASIYRLELVNLVKNGDFEEALSADWTAVDQNPLGTTLEMQIVAGTGQYAMAGNVLYFNIEDPNDYLDLNLLSALNGFEEGGRYVLRYNLKSINTGGITFEQRFREAENDAVEWSFDITTKYRLYEIPYDFEAVDSSFDYNADQGSFFTIGASQKSGTTQKGYLDNLRAGRTDVQSRLVFDVPWRDGGRPDLLSGYYRFSVMVKNDPTVTPNTANRIPARDICLGISTQNGYTSETFHQAWEESSDGTNWAEWTEVYVVTDNSVQIDRPAGTMEIMDYYPLELKIIPADPTGGSDTYDVGSILIAEPSLEFSADGIFE